MENECYTYFAIKGEFDPNKITLQLGITPSKCWSIGDKRRNGKSSYDFALWECGRCDDYEMDIEKQCLKTISVLSSKINILKEIKKNNDVNLVLEIVPMLYSDETTPALVFNRKIIEFCYLTNTHIDIDLYLYSSDETE